MFHLPVSLTTIILNRPNPKQAGHPVIVEVPEEEVVIVEAIAREVEVIVEGLVPGEEAVEEAEEVDINQIVFVLHFAKTPVVS